MNSIINGKEQEEMMATKKFKGILIAFIIFGLAAGPGLAQVEAPGAEVPVRPAPEAVVRAPGMISMDFQDANLGTVLKVLSEQSGMNFVAGEDVKDRQVTLYLNNVSVKDALDTILRANGLTWEGAEEAEIFIVKESGKPVVGTVTRVYHLNYANAKETKEKFKDREVVTAGLEDVIVEMLSEHGKSIVDERTNSLIVTDIPSQLELIEKTIAQLDTKTPQVMIEAEILETGANVTKDLGLEWGTSGRMFGIVGAQRSTAFPFLYDRRNLVNTSAEPTLTAISGVAQTTAATTIGPELGVVSFRELRIVLDALEINEKTKVLGRPKVLTLNNKPAEIHITEETAVASVTSLASGANITTATSGQAERITTGITLKVTPQINKDDYITMLIEPSVITPVSSEFFPGIFVDPQTRSARTTVRVKDGETVVIGGLMSTEKRDKVKKVPILGDVPILGLAFRNVEDASEDKELVIFITPHIVKEGEMVITPEEVVQLERAPAPRMLEPVAPPKEKKPEVLEREQEEVLTREDAMEKAIMELR